jgi:hypothetical protein
MKRLIFKGFLVTLFIMGTATFNTISSQEVPPPPPEQGQGGNQPPGGGAPIGEGMIFLTMLGAAYGAKKWQKSKQTN